MNTRTNPLEEELVLAADAAREDLEMLRGAHVLITGGTGFVGKWLVELLSWASLHFGLHVHLSVLARHHDDVARTGDGQAPPTVSRICCDVREPGLWPGQVDYVIHAAAPVGVPQSLDVFDTIVHGTNQVLRSALAAKARRVLFVSSGAVYGKQPHDLLAINETYLGGPDVGQLASAYAESKRAAELLCTIYLQQFGVQTVIARCFAFVGPHLPLTRHFAIGNFIWDALRRVPIRVSGSPDTVRSYLYAADLAVWLLRILVRGEAGTAYNVGGSQEISMGELAHLVASALGNSQGVHFDSNGAQPTRYVPDVSRALTTLGLQERHSLVEGIVATARFAQNSRTT